MRTPASGATRDAYVIGIICGNEIIVAADTMFSDTLSGSVSYASKIDKLEFRPGDHVLIAQAGLPAITNRIVEIAKENCVEKSIKSPLSVTEIIENAVRQLKNECHADQWEHGKYYGAHLLIAFFVNRKPCLFKLDIYGLGVAQRAINHFACAGAGGPLAEYAMRHARHALTG